MIQEWELLNPEGRGIAKPVEFEGRILALEGKTVVLRWNGKPNGDIFLNRIAELLMEKVKNIKVIKAYEVAPETSMISHGIEKSVQIAKTLLSFNPDIVIAAQAD